MSQWHRENPELAEEIAKLPLSEQNAAERALMPDPLERADRERDEGVRFTFSDPEAMERLKREAEEAERLHDTDPGRWPDWASPARMKRDIERDREEDEQRRP